MRVCDRHARMCSSGEYEKPLRLCGRKRARPGRVMMSTPSQGASSPNHRACQEKGFEKKGAWREQSMQWACMQMGACPLDKEAHPAPAGAAGGEGARP